MIATLDNPMNNNIGDNMKLAVGIIILSIFVIFVASPVNSIHYADSVEVSDTTESSPSKPDSNNQEPSIYPILLAMSFLGLVTVRRPKPDK